MVNCITISMTRFCNQIIISAEIFASIINRFIFINSTNAPLHSSISPRVYFANADQRRDRTSGRTHPHHCQSKIGDTACIATISTLMRINLVYCYMCIQFIFTCIISVERIYLIFLAWY